jgi:outer membrane scaffolding protein for murein synthesis (MipA/OmpV family)
MKKIVASVGLAALGASGLQTTLAQSLNAPDNSKPWSISASIRGFYDDNPSTWPDSQPVPAGYHKSTFGFEVSPSAALRWALEQTQMSLGLVYTLKYYDNKPINSSDHYDQIFTLNAGLDHAFSEIHQVSIRDSFVIGQEPDLLRSGESFTTYQRISGDNIRNYGAINFEARITPIFSGELGYNNALYDYSASGPGSLSALLDRVENRAHLEGRWEIQRETHGTLGYEFRDTSYTDGESISPGLMSESRNNRSHYFYAGVEHRFLPEVTGSVRAGAQYTEYYNDPFGGGDHWSPYARASLRWAFQQESSLELGFSYDRNATDVVAPTAGSLTRDAQSAAVYGSLVHKITPKLTGSLLGQYQNSAFEGGEFDGKAENYYLVGLNLEYRFTPNLAGNAGYNYDNLDSQIGRSFDRNRVYIGLTATY